MTSFLQKTNGQGNNTDRRGEKPAEGIPVDDVTTPAQESPSDGAVRETETRPKSAETEQQEMPELKPKRKREKRVRLVKVGGNFCPLLPEELIR